MAVGQHGYGCASTRAIAGKKEAVYKISRQYKINTTIVGGQHCYRRRSKRRSILPQATLMTASVNCDEREGERARERERESERARERERERVRESER